MEQWNRRFAFPHLKCTGFQEALTSVAAEFDKDIPTVRGDGGPYWETSVEHAYVADALERDLDPMNLSDLHTFAIDVKPHAIITIRILSRIATPTACGRFCDMSSTRSTASAH